MAQKSKKQTRKSPAVESAVPGSNASMSSAPATTVSASSGRSFTTEFNPDYSQTIKDLKRIAILAGTFFVVLVVLAFVLQ